MSLYWTNPIIKEYFLQNIFDVDEIVRRFGSLPYDVCEYEIKRKYFNVESIGERNVVTEITEGEYEYNKNDDNFFTNINYKEFIDDFWFDEFKEFIINTVLPEISIEFLNYTKQTILNLNESQSKALLIDVLDNLINHNSSLKMLLKTDDLIIINVNKIQQFVITIFCDSYLKTKDYLINEFHNIYPQLTKDYTNQNEDELLIESRSEILNKLIGVKNPNYSKFLNYEKKLIIYGYLDKHRSRWLKNTAQLIRFYNFCERNETFKDFYTQNSEGAKALRTLYGCDNDSLDSPSKRRKQSTPTTKTEFNFLDI